MVEAPSKAANSLSVEFVAGYCSTGGVHSFVGHLVCRVVWERFAWVRLASTATMRKHQQAAEAKE